MKQLLGDYKLFPLGWYELGSVEVFTFSRSERLCTCSYGSPYIIDLASRVFHDKSVIDN